MNYQSITLPFKREIWEHKTSFFGVFIAFASALIFVGIITLIQAPNLGEVAISIQNSDAHITPPTTQEGNLDIDKAITGVLQHFVQALLFVFISLSTIITFFYLLNSLYDDRKDRSIYFWKSLPTSETQVVITKFITGIYIIPTIAMAVGFITSIIAILILCVFLPILTNYSFVNVLTTPEIFLGTGRAFAFLILTGIWVTPFCAWLTLASAVSKSSPFLWALLPPIGIVMIEELFFRESILFSLVSQYVSILINATDHNDLFGVFNQAANLFSSPQLYIGFVLSAAMLSCAIWLRNNRYEI